MTTALGASSPQAEPGPAGEQRVEGGERHAAEPADGAPLHAAEGDAPDRHHRLAQRVPGQRRFRRATAAHPRHRLDLGHDRFDEHVDVGKNVPRSGLRLC
jgi:hypothetical protein